MKKILALTMFLILIVIGTSLADVPPQEPRLATAELIIQAYKSYHNHSFETLIVMEEDYCILYIWKVPSKLLKIQLPGRGIKMTIPDVSIMPQEVPDLKIIIRTVDVK
jgi:hypothetical protein